LNNTFDVSELASGSYFIEAFINGRMIRTHFVKY
jgi:hypothetical protein